MNFGIFAPLKNSCGEVACNIYVENLKLKI